MLLKKVVVAEDDDAIAHMISMTLGDAGFLCLRARDGEEALRLVRRENPDCLVLDIMMPHTDGIEVAKRLKADVIASRVPILMVTALGAVNERIKGLDSGADDYLAKPFDLRELAARVRALIRTSVRERDRNPITNLPGASAVENQVEALFRTKEPFAFLYLELADFETYFEAAGFRSADAFIAEVGNFILQRSQAGGDTGSFVGHLGGDDFVVITTPVLGDALAARLVADFEKLSTRDEATQGMRLVIGMVDSTNGEIPSPEALAGAVAQAKRQARAASGSNVAAWAPFAG